MSLIVNQLKDTVRKAIAADAKSLNDLSQAIWKNPELNYKETKAHAVLTEYLETKGFLVQHHYHENTAFRAEFPAPGGSGEVTVCIMCEYDALPEIGHACGHNLIAEAGVAAALGVKAALEKNKKVAGKLIVMGTPAEEGGGGKIRLMNAGALDDVHFAMMSHPTRHDTLYAQTLAIQHITVRFFGREAHAAATPWEGINALDAAVACYSNISLCRQQMRPTWRVHAINTKGGVMPNIIPAETEMLYYIRAPNWKELETLRKMVVGCFEASAQITGCRMEYEIDEDSNYDSMLLNGPMLEAYKRFGEERGVKFTEEPMSASTDMGNVSFKIPSIHPWYAIPTKAANHTKEFTADAGDPKSQQPTLISAECMALTTLQLFTDPELREQSRKDFERGKKLELD